MNRLRLLLVVGVLGAWLIPRTGPVERSVLAGPALVHATFAGGCFWSMERAFEGVPGVVSVTSGYTDGRLQDPSYRQVSSGGTGHLESVDVLCDPAQVSYEMLLDTFWHNVDPTQANGQFCDYGEQYRTGIFVHGDAQRRAAEASKATLGRTKPFEAAIVTPIRTASRFWPAEEEHQDYAARHPWDYALYRKGCGRDARLAELWGSAAATH